jgi:hypothetical protein
MLEHPQYRLIRNEINPLHGGFDHTKAKLRWPNQNADYRTFRNRMLPACSMAIAPDRRGAGPTVLTISSAISM